jgi:hypothetical protein
VAVVKRSIDGRDFWFAAEQVEKEDPETGEYCPTDKYYCTFSMRVPGPPVHGEVLQDQENRARIFKTADEAIAAGIREVHARCGLAAKFAVGLPYGNKDAEFKVYIRVLKEMGIAASKSRAEDAYGRKWPHVWDNREDAERFGIRLRKESGNPDWEVYEFSEPRTLGGDGEGRGPIDILVGRQSNGRTYGLHPNSFKVVRKRFPTIHPRSSVFMGLDSSSAFEGANGTTFDQIAALLTGLSPEKLAELGGYRIVDPVTGLVLHATNAVPAGVGP